MWQVWVDLRGKSAIVRTTGQMEAIFVKVGYSLTSQLQGLLVKILSKILLSNLTWAIRQSWSIGLFTGGGDFSETSHSFHYSPHVTAHAFFWSFTFFRLWSVLPFDSFTQWQLNQSWSFGFFSFCLVFGQQFLWFYLLIIKRILVVPSFSLDGDWRRACREPP